MRKLALIFAAIAVTAGCAGKDGEDTDLVNSPTGREWSELSGQAKEEVCYTYNVQLNGNATLLKTALMATRNENGRNFSEQDVNDLVYIVVTECSS
jgi:hypothetical protein